MSTIRIDLDSLSDCGNQQGRAADFRLNKIIAYAQHEKKRLLASVTALKTRMTRLKTADEKLQRKSGYDLSDETLFLLRRGEELQQQCAQLLRYAAEQAEAAARGEAYLIEQKRALECITQKWDEKRKQLLQIVAQYKSVHAATFC